MNESLMNFLIEEPKMLMKKDEVYWTFWVRIFLGAQWVSFSGFRYWPATDKLGTPAIKKDGGRYFNTCKMNFDLYGAIKHEARRIFHGVEQVSAEQSAEYVAEDAA